MLFIINIIFNIDPWIVWGDICLRWWGWVNIIVLTFNKTVIQHRCCWVLAADACIWHTWQTNWTPSEICLCLWVSSLEIGIRCSPIKTAHEIGLKLLLNNEVCSHDGVIQRWSTEMDVCGRIQRYAGQYAHCLHAYKSDHCSWPCSVYHFTSLCFLYADRIRHCRIYFSTIQLEPMHIFTFI